MTLKKLGTLFALILVSSSAFASSLKIVTWNVEFLTAKSNTSCAPRTNADYERLSEFAKLMDADIYALQEVESAQALARVFDTDIYDFIVSPRTGEIYDCRDNKKNKTTQQRVAYAIKKSVNYNYNPSENLTKLDLAGDSSLRYGLVIQLPKATLMNVHLKSACHSGDVLSNGKGCDVKKEQFDALTKWVNTQPKSKELVMLGDFNHKFGQNDYFLNNAVMKRDITAHTSIFNSCVQRYSSSQGIDHIISSFDRLKVSMIHYVDKNGDGIEDSDDTMLSDHCPIMASMPQ
ncbi:hydrolase [Vibrio sp. MACH09]|uniref:hypothetical protein n=1 Tax=Vibrio sp. MACH09 TaxID=3025122 RepID=UPI0027951408|nr:hypothetical protein [Vibrio sp. MACH09]GLO62521.1 hydrolase [Vibrio sp. MACH09]